MIYNNTIVNQNGAYLKSGGLIPNTQRIPLNQPQEYWQQANANLPLVNVSTPNKHFNTAIYIGRIPLHFGHFLIEGLSKMSDLPFLNLPFIGYLTKGCLPPNIKSMEESQARILINILSKNTFIEIEENDQIEIDSLIFNNPPMTLSHTVHDPVKMSNLIKHITTECKKLHPMNPIENLYLNRLDEPIKENSNNPNDDITLQIAKVANAKSLEGIAGSNTHLSMFANQNTSLKFIPRNDPEQTDRNQLLCNLIKMYNK